MLGRYSAQRGWMAIVTRPVDSGALKNNDLDAAVAAYVGRFTGMSRQHAASDLNVYLAWCRGRGLAPLTNRRGHLELYVRWLQETRRFNLQPFHGESACWPASIERQSSTAS